MTGYTREEWRGLVDRIAKVVKERDAALAVLRKVEWVPRVQSVGVLWMCPVCFAWKPDPHKDDCALDAALTGHRAATTKEVPG